MTALVIRGDARSLPLSDASVDLIVTSPPYWGQRSYTDGGEHYGAQIGAEDTPAAYIRELVECTREWMRVLKPSGSLWVNLGDKYVGAAPGSLGNAGSKTGYARSGYRDTTSAGRPKSLLGLPWRYAIGCTDGLGLILRAEIIWSKPNGLPENVTDRVRRIHEQWFHLTKHPRYFAAIDELRNAPSGYTRTNRAARATPKGVKPRTMTDSCNPLGSPPVSVWEIATEPLDVPDHLGVDHFAAFPTEWPRRIIRGWSPAGGVIVDPFGGTGTTALVASALGRTGISVDMSADYCRLARWRTTDPAQIAKALGVEKPPSQLIGQTDLLSLMEIR